LAQFSQYGSAHPSLHIYHSQTFSKDSLSSLLKYHIFRIVSFILQTLPGGPLGKSCQMHPRNPRFIGDHQLISGASGERFSGYPLWKRSLHQARPPS
jgi:hypothetical protein